VLVVDLQRWDVNSAPYELAAAVITEVHKRVCRHLRESYQEKESLPPNDERIAEIVELVSRHWTGPILVERMINETVRMVLEHWRERHNSR
jgi:predicted metal-binding protein